MPKRPPKDFVKPAVLYHASQNRNVDAFIPRDGNKRHKDEPAQVFAALDKAFATIFLHPFDDRKMASGFINDVPYVLVGDVAGFRAQDTGGAVYTLPSDSFTFDADLGVGYKEWTSTVLVKPLGKQEYDSALEAMLENGVQVYLADMDTLNRFREAHGSKLELIDTLLSENQKQHRNYTPFRNPER